MIELYFSLSSSFLFIAVLSEGKCLSLLQKENTRLHSENFVDNLRNVCDDAKIKLKEVTKIFFTSNPSNQTGLRISLTFVSTLQVINPEVEFYQIDTLLLQSGLDDCISLLSLNIQESKYHAKIFHQGILNSPSKTKIIDLEELEETKSLFPNLSIKKNLLNIDFLDNFNKLKNHFQVLKDIKEIEY
jgi:tRNA A37 threonylcarbamoyladenosine modification protein TsaB